MRTKINFYFSRKSHSLASMPSDAAKGSAEKTGVLQKQRLSFVIFSGIKTK